MEFKYGPEKLLEKQLTIADLPIGFAWFRRGYGPLVKRELHLVSEDFPSRKKFAMVVDGDGSRLTQGRGFVSSCPVSEYEPASVRIVVD